MSSRHHIDRFLLILLSGLLAFATWTADGAAAQKKVTTDMSLQQSVAVASPGDVLHLSSGVHRGPVTITKPLTLIGDPGAVVEGSGEGSVITVEAADTRIEGLLIRNSGTDLPAMDSAILVHQIAPRAVIIGNRFENNLFGVYLHGAADSIVQDNKITGRTDLRMAEAGNGVSIWNAPGAKIIHNDIRFGRDGVFVNTSRQNVFQDNRFRDLRFAIHYMYTNDSQIIGNYSEHNHVAWAIMYSSRLQIRDNVSIDDRDHGLMLNYANESEIVDNVVRNGGEKCLFFYNANKNEIRGNRFEGCPIGIHFTAGSERNVIAGNAFIGNRNQVKYVGTRYLDWSENGRGNYWSDNPAFDLNGDGIADRPYRPNGIMDRLLWTYPQAKALANSPTVELIRWAQERFPAIQPGGIVDTAPLMEPPKNQTIPNEGERQ